MALAHNENVRHHTRMGNSDDCTMCTINWGGFNRQRALLSSGSCLEAEQQRLSVTEIQDDEQGEHKGFSHP